MSNTYRYKLDRRENKAITLISLVITIVLLIILSGITISLILTDNGLFKKAEDTQRIQDVATLQERLELEKAPVQIEHEGMVDLESYLEQIQDGEKPYTLNSVEELNDTNAEIVVDEQYKFLVKDKENGDVEIIYEGIARIEDLTIEPTSATYTYPVSGTFEVTNNKSNGELSVTSKNENIATAEISGTTVTVTPGTTAGEIDIVVTSAENGEYAKNKVIHKATVLNGEIKLEADAYTGSYDGKEHPAITKVDVTPKDAKVEYSINDEAYSEDVPKVTGADTYTISIKASKAGYTTKLISKTVTIGRQANKTGNLTLSETSGTITYPTAGTFTVTKNVSGGDLSVTSSDTSVATVSIDKTKTQPVVTITPKVLTLDEQKATITVTSAATTNYEAQTVTYTATINKGTITLEADAYTGSYDGQAHNAVSNVKVTPSDATVKYKLDSGSQTTTIPTVTGAATYTVSIEATKAGYATKSISKTVTVSKQENTTGNLTLSATSGTVTYPTAATFTVTKNTSNGTLSVKSNNENVATASIDVTKTPPVVTVTPKVLTTDGQTATITVTSAATTNYEAQTVTYTATVNRGSITLEADAYTGSYDGQAHNAVSNVKVTPSDATVKYKLDSGSQTTTIPTVTGAATYTVSIEATKAGYATKSISKTVTVSKQENTTGNLTLSATSGTVTYPTAGTFTVTKNTSGGTLTVTSSNTNAATASIDVTKTPPVVTITPKAVSADAQKTIITVKSAATTNYEEQTVTYTATVNRGSITLEADAYTGSYDGQAHNAVSNVKVTPSDATVKYKLDSGSQTTTIPTVTGAATYTVSIEASKTGYATKSISKTVTVSKKNVSGLTVNLNPTSFTYTGAQRNPAVTVLDGTKTLTIGTDYTVEYSNNVNAGTATVTVTGQGNYTGTKQVNYAINRANGSVSLSASSGSIKVDQTTTFTVNSNTSGGTLSVSSSNAGIATASINGNTITVVGKGVGSTTITVTSAITTNYNAASATYTISVAKKEGDPILYTAKDLYNSGQGWNIEIRSDSNFKNGPQLLYGVFGNDLWLNGIGEQNGSMAYNIAWATRTIDTHGCSKVTIKSGPGWVSCGAINLGGVQIQAEKTEPGKETTTSINTSSSIQTLQVTLNCGRDFYNVQQTGIESIYFHN